MKVWLSIVALASSCAAFSPIAPRQRWNGVSVAGRSRESVAAWAEKEVPFFAAEASEDSAEVDLDSLTEEEEIELAVQEEMRKTRVVSNLRNANGVDYAPWMNISAEDEAKIRQLMKEKTAARRAREEQERSVSGNLYFDSQAQELSGTGLNYKIIDGQVELEWATKQERNTQGFVVKRRPAKTDDFSTIASYQDFGPLCSQGPDGGVYRYLDDTVSPGGWVYRITEADDQGTQSDLCQCLVEVQTEEEQRAALIAGVGIGLFAVIAVVAGVALDPMGGY